MILEYRTAAWWYWLAALLAIAAALAGWSLGPATAMLATGLHGVHFLVRGCALTSFPLQVRAVYFLLLAAGAWPVLGFLHWALLVGTTARVAFAYCFLARSLSLLPWNCSGPLNWERIQRAYLTPPTRGSILLTLADRKLA